jgi:hypothetical protein
LEGAGGPCGGGVGGGVAVAVDGEFGAEFAAEPGELVDGGVGGDVDEALLPACDEFDGEVALGPVSSVGRMVVAALRCPSSM